MFAPCSQRKEQLRVKNSPVLDSFLQCIEGFYPGSLPRVFLSHQKVTIATATTLHGDIPSRISQPSIDSVTFHVIQVSASREGLYYTVTLICINFSCSIRSLFQCELHEKSSQSGASVSQSCLQTSTKIPSRP